MSHARLRGGGSGEHHSAYFGNDGRLVVEWYETSDHAPYEHATMVLFDGAGQAALAQAMDLWPGPDMEAELLAEIQARFETYFQVRSFADENRLPYTHKVSFTP